MDTDANGVHNYRIGEDAWGNIRDAVGRLDGVRDVRLVEPPDSTPSMRVTVGLMSLMDMALLDKNVYRICRDNGRVACEMVLADGALTWRLMPDWFYR